MCAHRELETCPGAEPLERQVGTPPRGHPACAGAEPPHRGILGTPRADGAARVAVLGAHRAAPAPPEVVSLVSASGNILQSSILKHKNIRGVVFGCVLLCCFFFFNIHYLARSHFTIKGPGVNIDCTSVTCLPMK